MSEEHPVIGDTADPLIGTVLAERYRIERRLGEGGMGAVYLARHVILEKIVALKVLHDEYARRRELVERFLHEAKAASRIRHEHVIDITDFGETSTKNVFFAMEFLDGHDLATELNRGGQIAWPRIKRMALQLCAALQAAHEAGVIHRDLKPENIYLIERLGNPDFVKVLDFGVAKLTEIDEGRRLTRTGMVFGTPEYMSPEQARGEKPDARVDVYATGCILFEMVTGDVPYRGDNFMGVLTKHLFDPLPLVAERTARTDLPPGVQDVISQAMAKDKNQRFSSMNELAVALDTLDQTDGVVYHAPGAGPTERSRRHHPPAAPVLPSHAPHDRTGPASRAKTTPAGPAASNLDVHDDDLTMPRAAAVPASLGISDSELPVARGRARGLIIGGGVLAALLVGAFVYVKSRAFSEPPLPDPPATRAPAPAVVRPETPTTVAAPAPAPEPPPVAAVATPQPASALAPDAAVAAPAPAPEPVVDVAPPPEPEAAPVHRPSSRDREREHRRRPTPVVRPQSPAPAPVAAPSPAPTTTPPSDVVTPKSDLKDPFKKK